MEESRGHQRETAIEERYASGRIEVWRRNTGERWFVTILPDPGVEGYPGHTYAREGGEIPSSVPDQPKRLIEWARTLIATDA